MFDVHFLQIRNMKLANETVFFKTSLAALLRRVNFSGQRRG